MHGNGNGRGAVPEDQDEPARVDLVAEGLLHKAGRGDGERLAVASAQGGEGAFGEHRRVRVPDDGQCLRPGFRPEVRTVGDAAGDVDDVADSRILSGIEVQKEASRRVLEDELAGEELCGQGAADGPAALGDDVRRGLWREVDGRCGDSVVFAVRFDQDEIGRASCRERV